MLFNSISFAIFFITFFVLYWFVFQRSLKLQNIFILAGSYVFYGWWNWRLLGLIIITSFINYLLGIFIGKATSAFAKKALLYVGVALGITSLLYFKYTNFFIISLVDSFARFNVTLSIHTISLILPLGISFYTFKTISYLLDIYKGKFKPTIDPVVFFSYVAFFPCLVAGPIDKAKTLIPQLERKRELSYDSAVDGLRQILWGLFKKLVIADNLAKTVDHVFDNYHIMPGSALLLGCFYFSFQLYADFSGYSDIAIGISRLLGFDVTKNFNLPYFAQSIPEFWRKWHMSLTGWLTEYIFTPSSIALRDLGNWGAIISIMITFLVSGLWHGANWTFVIWGFMHGCYYIPAILNGTINKNKKIDPHKLIPSATETFNILKTFTLVTFTFILFRSGSLAQAFVIIKSICSVSLLTKPALMYEMRLFMIPMIVVFLIAEWLQRTKEHTLKIDFIKNTAVRFGIYYALVIAILLFASSSVAQFLYLKF